MKRLFMVFVVFCALQAATAGAASFTNNGNGTVTDNGTGLMWQQGEPGSMTWANALPYCDGLSLGGQTDWRLPNIKELESITDDTKYSPAIDKTYFPNADAYYYWSSTTFAGGAGSAWIVDFGDGFVDGYVNYYYKSSYYYVRCVRGGQSGALCNLAISPSSQTFSSPGGTGSVTVTASATSCAWTASESLDWVTITSGASGTGNGTVTFSVAANTTGATKTGNITIADQTFTVTQAAAPANGGANCSQYSDYFEEASKTYNIPSNLLRAMALTESDCVYDEHYENGKHVCGIMQLTGDTLNWAIALLNNKGISTNESEICSNTSTGNRLNILGGAAVLNSKKCWASPKVYSGNDFNNCAQNGADFFTEDEKQKLTTTLETWWWPTVAYNGGGVDGFITTTNYPYRAWNKFQYLNLLNNISYPPIDHIQYLLNGQTTPDNKTVLYNSNEILSNDDDLYPTPAQLGSLSNGGIRWTKPDFNPFTEVTLHKNDGAVYSSTSCIYTITPTSQPFAFTGGTASITVTASATSCAWTASSALDWVTISSGSSSTGNGTVTISVSANTAFTKRTGNITIADQTFTVTQAAAPSCTYTIKLASKTFTSKKANVLVDVTATGNGCTLSPTENYDWITATLSGKFTQDKTTKKWSGKVKVEVSENKSSATRTGTVDIGGQTFTVIQSGVPCTLKISPETTKTPLAGAGATGSFTVTAPDGCNWTATPDKTAWLTITSGDSSTGNGTVNYTALENTGKKRTGKINVVTSDKKSKKVFTAVQNKK